ncbi:MAG TPA: ribose-5-phosphate isomerase RpiA [Myxococcota bacterium]|nr:ribose-5-phosphate isomerase RpiA [Myxococcota bacterium]
MTLEGYALEQVRPGHVLGLGTGRAAERFVRALAARVASGLEIRAVATSRATAELAGSLGIPVIPLDDAPRVDLAVDGADEVDPDGRMIKGYGGALLREKVVAAAAERVVILVGTEKCVPRLGTRGRLPVEVLPFALAPVRRRLAELGVPGTVRLREDLPQASDNGNLLVDCSIGPLADPDELDRILHAIPGLLETGLFLECRAEIAVERADGVEIRTH